MFNRFRPFAVGYTKQGRCLYAPTFTDLGRYEKDAPVLHAEIAVLLVKEAVG